jgi:hypothetical protein
MATVNAVAARVDEVGGSASLARTVLWTMLGAKVMGAWGLHWDIQWHLRIGRDSFWIPPHLMTYASVALVVVLSFGLLAAGTARQGSPRDMGPRFRMLGLVGTRGAHLAAWGIALTVLAAPIDDLWHRLFGLDVTLWSPPHLLGLAGAAVNSLGCVVLARELYPRGGRTALAAAVISGALFYGVLRVVVGPAFDLAYAPGGIAFHAHAILGALLLPAALVAVARVTGVRAAPLWAAIVSALMAVSGDVVAHVGFAALQPVSVIEESIARDPSSAIAVANAVARKNRQTPGTVALLPIVVSLVSILVLVAVDARRRPRLASVGYAIAVFALGGAMLARAPAFAANAPGAGATLAALALTLATAVIGATAGTRLAEAAGP